MSRRAKHGRNYGAAGYAALDRYRREVRDWSADGPDGSDGRHSYTAEETGFLMAAEREQRRSGVVRLADRDVFALALRLGYRRAARAQ